MVCVALYHTVVGTPRYLINLRDGEGSFESALKTVFSGQWKVGFRHGHGIEIGLHGRYTGTYVKNVRKGRGKLEYPNGDRLASLPCAGSDTHLLCYWLALVLGP